jgi:5-methylcytosine-specific restriction protein A
MIALGQGFIHVHHLKELASIAKEYEVDPIKDLRPVCPNCHAMLHQRKPALTISKLRQLLTVRNPDTLSRQLSAPTRQ